MANERAVAPPDFMELITYGKKYVEYSVAKQAQFIREQDIIMLPDVGQDIKRAHCSHTRLIDSLMLGIPVVGAQMVSYKPYNKYTPITNEIAAGLLEILR